MFDNRLETVWTQCRLSSCRGVNRCPCKVYDPTPEVGITAVAAPTRKSAKAERTKCWRHLLENGSEIFFASESNRHSGLFPTSDFPNVARRKWLFDLSSMGGHFGRMTNARLRNPKMHEKMRQARQTSGPGGALLFCNPYERCGRRSSGYFR
jgi:hypothetical protein